ncbi:mitotic spindle checkpoint protein Bub3 [Emydomyces testavorans]|uniref:Mitotic spindle checkpoint protein Bub3 n=1 Tax=Emydomyces testavorans TaxID=2070801 RepID=A0AAF0IJJ4_9EURO|nr:mitotic spindle checkpoint protein Bub3 [Emydomyces testavorans]
MASNQFAVPDSPTDAISSVTFSSDPDSTRFAVSSWDKNVYLYDLRDPRTGQLGEGTLVGKFEHRAPVLDVSFGEDDNELYTGGLDWDVRRIDVPSSAQTVLSSHSAGVKSVVYSKEHKIVVSASWDSTLHVHRTGTDIPLTPAVISLPSKPFSLSITPTKLVVAMASRALHIYDLRSLATFTEESGSAPPPNKLDLEPWQRRESSLKFMTRAVACMPNDAGYASSSIEGRVAVEWFDPSPESQDRKYAFKCHRQNVDGVDVVYPVNALAFHPVFGTFASGGGDGVVALWDGIAKRRIRQYQKYPSSVAALAFSANGKYLAIGISPGFEDGKDDIPEGTVKLFIRELGETEAKGKGGK